MAGRCELLENCMFFHDRLPNMPDYADLLKELYCLDDYPECARYGVFLKFGVEAVPADLFPNEAIKGRELVAMLSKKKNRG
mgnify:CR=1 FL=1